VHFSSYMSAGGVRFGPGRKQDRENLHRVGRCLLPDALDTVRRDVVEQRRVVPPPRAGAHQVRIVVQHLAQSRSVARHDRFRRALESCHRAICPDVGRECRQIAPALECVVPCDHEPRVIRLEHRAADGGERSIPEPWMEPFERLGRPGIARPEGCEQVRRLPVVRLKGRVERQSFDMVHANLPRRSLAALHRLPVEGGASEEQDTGREEDQV
jgi:hypothetical protein